MTRRQFDRTQNSIFRRSRRPPRPKNAPASSASDDAYAATISELSAEPPAKRIAQPPPPQERRSSRKGGASWGLPLLWLTIVGLLGGTGYAAFLLLTLVPPPPNCEQVSPIAADSERLYCANQAASSRQLEDLVAAVALVRNWTEEHPLYRESQRFLEEWSKGILAIASAKMSDGDLQEAIKIAGNVPESSPLYDRAQQQIAAWQSNWDKGAAIYEEALEALKNQNWGLANQKAEELSRLNNEHWRAQRYNELTRFIASEQLARRRLSQARELAEYQTVARYKEAMDLARQVELKSFARPDAQAEIARWSRALLKIADERLAARDLEGAIAAANTVPPDSSLSKEAEDFVVFSRAMAMSWKDNLMMLLEAQAIVGEIQPDRPLYERAQAQIQTWQASIQDLLQIQVASAVASVGQPLTFRLADELAQMVAQGRPRRIEAQTKIASWRKEIQSIQDRPFIIRARQIAQTESIESLKAAIAEASRVEIGRPRRIEAQTLIAQWNKKIEVLEDQPILNEARSVANSGNLSQAINIAQRIQPGRVLYNEAQDAIYGWTIQIQVAEDRAILNDASYLASIGQYSEAIRTASRIRWGRPLYDEAQGSIARWTAERNALFAPPPPPAPRSYSEPPASSWSEPEPAPYYPPEPAPESAPPPLEAPIAPEFETPADALPPPE
ncbi:MAG: hypothetical protein LRZ84_03620 [Desertifilum sp.]|nr:hypothetical protein [Desertifilum sp.]